MAVYDSAPDSRERRRPRRSIEWMESLRDERRDEVEASLERELLSASESEEEESGWASASASASADADDEGAEAPEQRGLIK